jgi:3-hydroxyacyl-[acyl-carrier-protein] dehydratase
MLLKDFYTILHQSGPEEEISQTGIHSKRFQFQLELNPDHPVYEGHFPGNPIVPGVCQVQMITELLSIITGSSLRLIHADNVKFLSIMVLNKKSTIDADIRVRTENNGNISTNAVLKSGETTFIKFKGVYMTAFQ